MNNNDLSMYTFIWRYNFLAFSICTAVLFKDDDDDVFGVSLIVKFVKFLLNAVFNKLAVLDLVDSILLLLVDIFVRGDCLRFEDISSLKAVFRV